MDFLQLKKELETLSLSIFSVNDVVKLTGQSKDVIKVKLSRLAAQEKIYHLKKGYYALQKIQSKYPLQQVFNDTYVGVHSALEYYESTTQRFRTLDLVTKKLKHKQYIQDYPVLFHNIKEEFFFGYKKIYWNNVQVFISTLEKTLIDCIYFSSKVYLSESVAFIRKYKNELDTEVLSQYLSRIRSSTLNKRLGYLLEKEGIHLKNLNMNQKYEKLSVSKHASGKKNTKWKLIINEEL